jgi:hypothetical protein
MNIRLTPRQCFLLGWGSGTVDVSDRPSGVAVPTKQEGFSIMRHIPKLAAVVGSVTIGLLGFQGVASAHDGYDGHGHGKFVYFPKPPPKHHHHGHGGHGYPGTTTTTSTTTTTTTTLPKKHGHGDGDGDGDDVGFHKDHHGGGYKLESSVHHKGHKGHK